jgi:hypothetical protein
LAWEAFSIVHNLRVIVDVARAGSWDIQAKAIDRGHVTIKNEPFWRLNEAAGEFGCLEDAWLTRSDHLDVETLGIGVPE